jgi:hypothetical protein
LFKNQIKEDSPTHFTHLLFILSFREKENRNLRFSKNI